MSYHHHQLGIVETVNVLLDKTNAALTMVVAVGQSSRVNVSLRSMFHHIFVRGLQLQLHRTFPTSWITILLYPRSNLRKILNMRSDLTRVSRHPQTYRFYDDLSVTENRQIDTEIGLAQFHQQFLLAKYWFNFL